MSNPTELALVEKAIKSGLGGCVEWDVDVVDRMRRELARRKLTLSDVRKQLFDHVRNGGAVLQVREDREPWKNEREYWYKVIVPIPQLFPKGLFVELVLADDDPELPEVELVNAHEQI